MKKTALLITALFGASLANAHNVWLEPVKDVKGQYVVKFGHEETETYPQSKLKAVRPVSYTHLDVYKRQV